MAAFIEKLRGKLDKTKLTKPRLILYAVILALAVALCISIIMQGSIHHDLSRARECAVEETYQNMISMRDLFAFIDNPEVDVQNKLLPELKRNYSAITALDKLLREGFEAEPVLSDEVINAIQAAFDEFALAYRDGDETGLARDDLEAQISTFAPMITKRYEKVDPNLEGVVVIDGFKKS